MQAAKGRFGGLILSGAPGWRNSMCCHRRAEIPRAGGLKCDGDDARDCRIAVSPAANKQLVCDDIVCRRSSRKMLDRVRAAWRLVGKLITEHCLIYLQLWVPFSRTSSQTSAPQSPTGPSRVGQETCLAL
mmetsp:Transcript_43376/g.92886  ORF Transcript_43376/g.92886 Transcript_43376/m.92886 type:complete len:130 (-) Transcript_43376:1096-1485(-)